MIEVQKIPVGVLDTNCYIVTDTDTNEIAIVDPGAVSSKVRKFVDAHKENIKYILLTHGHFDHIAYVSYIQSQTNAKVVISKEDEPMLNDSMENLSLPFMGKDIPHIEADIIVNDNDTIPFGSGAFTFLSTPGHTTGSGCFLIENHIFTGDTLMKLSMGRTDFPNGSAVQMKNSLKRLCQLSDDYKVYPGHGALSDMKYEKMYNPYVR